MGRDCLDSRPVSATGSHHIRHHRSQRLSSKFSNEQWLIRPVAQVINVLLDHTRRPRRRHPVEWAAGNPHVKIFNGQHFLNGTFEDSAPDESLLAQSFVYGANFNVGATVAAGDVNQDGFTDLVTGATIGNPHVKVFDGLSVAGGAFTLMASFFPYALQFNVGANVALGDVTKDGFADVITGATAGNPHVKVYNGQAMADGVLIIRKQMRSFHSFHLHNNSMSGLPWRREIPTAIHSLT